MPIVPLSYDVSIKTIRDVINLKSIVMSHVYGKHSSLTRYGVDQEDGQVFVRLKNLSSNYNPSLKLTLLRYGAIVGTKTFTLNSSTTVDKTFTGLPGYEGKYSTGYKDWTGGTAYVDYTGDLLYSVKIEELDSPNRSMTSSNFTLTKGGANAASRNIGIRANNPVTEISMAKDEGEAGITANYNLTDGIDVPESIKSQVGSEPSNTKLSDWRGTQVMDGNIVIGTTRSGRYGGDTNKGSITVYLDSDGFGEGTVTVEIGEGKKITKTLENNTYKKFQFKELLKGSYSVIITDNITGIKKVINANVNMVNYNTSLKYDTVVFNGTDRLDGFHWTS